MMGGMPSPIGALFCALRVALATIFIPFGTAVHGSSFASGIA